MNYKDIHGLHCTGCTVRDARFVWCYILEVCGLARQYFPYKCSTKSSFMWFGMQWTYIFKIWTSLTEGCFQFQMLTRAVFVSTARACGCAWLRVSSLMYLRLKMVLWRKMYVNTASYVLRDKTDRTNHITYISKEIRAWMQLYRSPAVYDIIVKNQQ